MISVLVSMCCWGSFQCRIPFFIAAPVTTLDLQLLDGAGIPIEQRGEEELTHFRGQRVVVEGINVGHSSAEALLNYL